MNPERFESIFRLIDREIWVVTSATQASRGGLVATWVSQASIDPTRPIVCLGIAPNHHTGQLIKASGRFALHLLLPTQASMALNFALGSGRDRDKFAEFDWRPGPLGMPVLGGVAAWMEGEIIHCFDGGDRWYFWGQIQSGEQGKSLDVLTERQLFAAATAEQLQKLKENREHDCEVQRPMFQHWLEQQAGLGPGSTGTG